MNEYPAAFPAIDVIGQPYAKGSMVAFANPRGGRPIIRPDTPFELGRWTGKVAEDAEDVWKRPLLPGAVAVCLTFRCPRPSLHYHEKDLDKLVRAVLDALQVAKVFKDDKQVALLLAVKYHLRASDPMPGVRMQLAPLEASRHVCQSFLDSLPNLDLLPTPA